jgi:hypothetical protein
VADFQNTCVSLQAMTLNAAVSMADENDRSRGKHAGIIHIDQCFKKCRQVAVDTILKLMDMYASSYETVAHAISLFDRVLVLCFEADKKDEFKDNFLGYSIACFLLAMKLREVSSPAVVDIIPNGWSAEQISSCEAKVLNLLDWAVYSSTGVTRPSQFLIVRLTL